MVHRFTPCYLILGIQSILLCKYSGCHLVSYHLCHEMGKVFQWENQDTIIHGDFNNVLHLTGMIYYHEV